VGAGTLLAALLAVTRAGLYAALAGAVAVGVVVGFVFFNWDEAIGGAFGGLAGAIGAAPIVRGTLRRGGTRGGTAALLGLGALALAALAFVPVLGYLEALAVPAFAARLRRRSPERYAGLRSLARD
ncbi:MAG: hypothetical protein ACR2MU_06170, partial [Gaiellaceae bacterium]